MTTAPAVGQRWAPAPSFVAAAVSALVLTLRADALRTVEYGLDYVVACILIDVICVAVVADVHLLLRGVDLHRREVTSTRRGPPRRSPAL